MAVKGSRRPDRSGTESRLGGFAKADTSGPTRAGAIRVERIVFQPKEPAKNVWTLVQTPDERRSSSFFASVIVPPCFTASSRLLPFALAGLRSACGMAAREASALTTCPYAVDALFNSRPESGKRGSMSWG